MGTRATPAPTGRPRSARLAPAERERLILDEAIRFFSEVGFGGQTRELSRRLGITQPLLYRYFPSKKALVERVYEEMFVGRLDPGWGELLDDRSRPIRERMIEFYRRYTRMIFRPEWIRLYMYSGLSSEGSVNKRYIARIEKLVLARICTEVRHAMGAPGPDEVPITPEEMEVIWCMHSGIFYYGIRKFIYRIRAHLEPQQVIELAVDETLAAAPDLLQRVVYARLPAGRPRTGAGAG